MKEYSKKTVKEWIDGKLSRYFGVSPKEASVDQVYKATAMAVRDILLEKRKDFNRRARTEGTKRVYYLCMEFCSENLCATTFPISGRRRSCGRRSRITA